MAYYSFLTTYGTKLTASSADDTIATMPYNWNVPMTVDGGAGTDTATFTKPKSNYTISTTSSGATVVTAKISLGKMNLYGWDIDLGYQYVDVTMTNVEVLKFDNGNGTYDSMSVGGSSTTASAGGTSGNDTFSATSKNDVFDGGAGIDTVIFAGKRTDYMIDKSATGYSVSGILSNAGGIDTLVNVERLKFSDMTIAFDIAGNAGQAYRLYQAAFNRTPDSGGLGFQTNAMDTGATLTQLAQDFINSPEFTGTYGNMSDMQYVTQLYQNVLHRAPDTAGLDFHVKNLAGGTSRAQTLVGFSESPENQAALIGVIQNGIEYQL